MGTIVTVPVDSKDEDHVAAVHARLAAFWPGVAITMGVGSVNLSSDDHDTEALTAIWTCALLNERLVAIGTPRRQRVLTDLLA